MPGNLFKNVYFYMSKTLPVEQSKQLSKVLQLNGATSTELDDGQLTHYIACSIPGQDTLEAIPETSRAQLVTPQWVERSLVLSAVQEPAFYSPDPAMLFSGVVATSADLSQSDNEVLCAGISSLGGQWRTAFTKDVTHLFAMNEGSAKYATAMHFREVTGVRVVVPHWFDDVVRLGMRNLPTEEYEFPDPKVFTSYGAEAIKRLTGAEEGEEAKDAKRNKPLSPHKKALYDTALASGLDLPPQRPASNSVWDGTTILLSSSLELSPGQLEAHYADVQRAGGTIIEAGSPEEEAEKVEAADIYVTKYRSGPAYVKAYRLNKTIGTLPWLWYVRSTGILSRPTDQLLHYPVPRNPIENFSRHVITITNYTGKDREYIKKLISAMGAEFTPSMSGRNTMVIAAYVSGTKTTKATSWNIPIVNHIWLEDCFIQWRDVPTANDKYIVFPPGVDFGTMIGEKGLGRIGYDAEELAVLEKEVELQENSEVSIRLPLASQPVAESPRKNKEATSTAVREDDAGMADISAGGYLDIDVPLDDDGRLSDIDILPGQEKDDDDDDLNVDESPTTRKTARTKTVKKPASTSPSKLKSILKSKRKSNPLTPAESEAEEDQLPASNPVKKSLVRRFRRSSAPAAVEDDPEEPKTPVKSPRRTSAKGQAQKSPKVAAGRTRPTEVESRGREDRPPSSSKLLVRKTYQAKSRSRSRSRANREVEDSEVEVVEPSTSRTKPKATRERSRSWSRGRAKQSPDSDDDDEKPKPVETKAKSARTRSTSRGRRTREDSDVALVSPPKPKTTRARSTSRGRAVTRKRKSDASETEERRPKAGGRIIMTRSRSRSRGLRVAEEGEDSDTRPNKPASRASKRRGKGKTVDDEDVDMDEVNESSEPEKPQTPSKTKAQSSKTTRKRTKPTVPTDTESEKESPHSRTPKRRKPAETTDESAPVKTTGRTPRREVSVVVPTLKQVRSQSLIRGDKEPSMAAKSSNTKDVTRTKAARDELQDVGEKRGRPAAQELSASSGSSPSPPPPTKTRRVLSTPEPGPSKVAVVPSSTVRTPSKRSAATKASRKLHDEIMPDVVSFQKELKSGHVKSAYDKDQTSLKKKGKETDIAATSKAGKGKKRASMDDGGSVSSAEEPEKKKQKTLSDTTARRKSLKSAPADESPDKDEASADESVHAKPSNKTSSTKKRSIVVLATQYSFTDDVIKAFTKLGGKFTTKPSECTHLVSQKIVRTEKFLCGLAIASYVVSEKWVETSVDKKRILSEDDFPLTDSTAEERFGVKDVDVLRRAKANKGSLFKGMSFYVTPKVPVDIKLLKNVVTAGGGQVLSQSPTLRIMKGNENRYIISHQNDVHIWRPLSQSGYPIYSQELILMGALKQEIDWDNDANKVPGSF